MFVCRLNHPVKKVKHDEGGSWEWVEEGGLGGRRGEDLYAGHTHTKMAPVEPLPACSPHYLKDGKTETNQVGSPLRDHALVRLDTRVYAYVYGGYI